MSARPSIDTAHVSVVGSSRLSDRNHDSSVSPVSTTSTMSGMSSMVSSPTTSYHDPLRNRSEYVLAMHDFTPQANSSTCISFRAGQVIHVINRDPSGWWDGELDGKRGWFPSNYVSSEDMLEKPPQATKSSTSWAGTPSPRNKLSIRSTNRANAESYCPAIMLPILHGLSLLKTAVIQKRTRHFSNSSACIVSCTRSILASVDCLARDSPTIQRFPMLYTERKEVLAMLSSFVAHTREAALKEDESERDAETEKMLRSGGQLFSRLRRFLAIVSQMGIPIPDVEESQSELGSTDTSYSLEESPPSEPPTRERQLTLTPRAKSLSDLREKNRARPPGASHKRNDSISSTASSSLASSPVLGIAEPGSPRISRSVPNMIFPSGTCSSREVLLALRATHDEYISSIGAFIGQVHSHARASYAAIHGHMYAFMRNIIEAVCRLLVLIGAVMSHSEISPYRRANLRDSIETLYNASSALAESVRRLTSDREVEASMTEDEEKQLLLQCATAALKIGSDAVAVTKMCLNKPTFTVQIPELEQTVSLRIDPSDLANLQERDVTGLNTLDSVYRIVSDEDEDMTVQVRAAVRSPPLVNNINTDPRDPKLSLTVKVDGPLATPTTLTSASTAQAEDEEENMLVPVEVTPPSPTTSFAPTERVIEDDRTTWNISVHSVVSGKSGASPTEEKILRGDLPIVPRETVAELARADPRAYLFLVDHLPSDVAYNNEGHLVGATLNVLVEKLTPHHTTVDHAFMAVFFMTFRMFATARELVGAIIARYNLVPPPGLSGPDEKMWQNSKGMPTRLRVANFVKTWLEIYWRPETDNGVLNTLDNFTREALVPLFPKMSRIVELINEQRHASTEAALSAANGDSVMTMPTRNGARPRSSSSATGPKEERARNPGMSLNPSVNVSEIPRPLMTKTILSTLRSRNFKTVNVTDFDPLELARQMTIKECQIYCDILPEEILESGQEGARPAVHVKQLTTLSTMITGWVAESILDESDTKKRTALMKFFIKLADRCTILNNFSTSRSILAALDSSTISRLSQTWMGLSQKSKAQLESLRKLADHGRNYREYRNKLRAASPPAVPFLGLYLTDVTFCREGNPSFRPSPHEPEKKLINFNKYHKLARIVQDLQRFQKPYNLKAIPEVQQYLNFLFDSSKGPSDFQDLYSRSLKLEPKSKANADGAPQNDGRSTLFNWTRSHSHQASIS